MIDRSKPYQNFYLLKEVSAKKGFGQEKKCCKYTYDALNRITGAIDNTGNYNLDLVQYDKNGNITKLKRQGHLNTGATNFGTMDDLTYSYDNGNKLMKVADAATIDQFGFKDDAVGTTADTSDDYSYDVNGNLLSDTNKGITSILYNYLNLPTEIKFNNSNTKKINYTYAADSVKIRKVVNDSGVITTTDYAGGYVYENNVLQFFPTSEGYVTLDGNNYRYVYQYRDHLDNIRLSYSDGDGNGTISQSEIIEENNYYPYGLKMQGFNTNVSSLGNSVAQRYMFGGKEFDDSFNETLNTYDFGARNYDPALGRWMNIDPLAEQMRRHSPYNYAFNNPIFFIDSDGMAPNCPDGDCVKKTVQANQISISFNESRGTDIIQQTEVSNTIIYNEDGDVIQTIDETKITTSDVDSDGNISETSTISTTSSIRTKNEDGTFTRFDAIGGSQTKNSKETSKELQSIVKNVSEFKKETGISPIQAISNKRKGQNKTFDKIGKGVSAVGWVLKWVPPAKPAAAGIRTLGSIISNVPKVVNPTDTGKISIKKQLN
jgi:RHS repeat-associated protein